MVTTIDGKILTGERDEPVHDLGSDVDHATMKAIEAFAQGIIMGAATIRATPSMNLPSHLHRYAVTQGGKVDPSHDFFAKSGDKAFLVMPATAPEHPSLPSLRAGEGSVDFNEILREIRQKHGVERLLCEGGSEVNAMLLEKDLVDELFWTVAPKIKLGRDVPTYADGNPLPRAGVTRWELVDQKTAGSELFLRYRRHR